MEDLIDYHIDDVALVYLNLPVDNMSLQVVATRKPIIQSRVDLLLNSKCQIASIDIAIWAARNLIDKAKFIEANTSFGLLNLWDTNAKISVLLNLDLQHESDGSVFTIKLHNSFISKINPGSL